MSRGSLAIKRKHFTRFPFWRNVCEVHQLNWVNIYITNLCIRLKIGSQTETEAYATRIFSGFNAHFDKKQLRFKCIYSTLNAIFNCHIWNYSFASCIVERATVCVCVCAFSLDWFFSRNKLHINCLRIHFNRKMCGSFELSSNVQCIASTILNGGQ